MPTIAHNYSDLQAINYGKEPENQAPKKNNHKRNLEQKPFTQTVTATFVMIQRIDSIAACLWYTMISQKEYCDYQITKLAKLVGICDTTCKAKMNILIRLGVVYRHRHSTGRIEYEVFQIPQCNIPESLPQSKPLTGATYPRKNINIYTKQHSNNNLVSPKPVPNVVVDTQNNFENKKTHDTDPTQSENCRANSETVDTKQNTRDNQPVDINPTTQSIHDTLTKTENGTTDSPPGPTFPGGTALDPSIIHDPAIDAVLSRIQPEHRQKIPIPLLGDYIDDYSIDQLADICIYAIDKTSAGNRNPEHHRRRIEGYCRVLLNKHIIVSAQKHYVPAQKHYTTYQNRDTIPLSVPVQTDYDYKKKWDEHHTRVKKVTEACIKETPEIENIKEKTDTYENVFDKVDMGSLILRLKERKPDIDPKYKARQRLYDRIGRQDLRGV